MISIKKNPFNYLPLNGGDLFDLTCEYLVFLLENLHQTHDEIIALSRTIHDTLPEPQRQLIRDCLVRTENFVDQYSKIVKCVKLSLGEKVSEVNGKLIFQKFSYNPDTELQYKMLNGFRNTQQHFEERLHFFDKQLDPFFKLAYESVGKEWEIYFGSGGLGFQGKEYQKLEFDEANLIIKSYRRVNKNQLITDSAYLKDLIVELQSIAELLKSNINNRMKELGTNKIPPPRDIGIIAGYNSFTVSFSPVEDDDFEEEPWD